MNTGPPRTRIIMELKWHKYIDIYDIPDEYRSHFYDVIYEYEVNQNSIVSLDREELKIDREDFIGNADSLDKVIEFLEKNNLTHLNVLYWW